MLRTFGFQDCVPLGDTALASDLQRFFALTARPDRHQTTTLMQRFMPHRSLATFHFWRQFQVPREHAHDLDHSIVSESSPGLPCPASG